MQQYPIDFKTRINNYKIKFPLEYEKTISDWCLQIDYNSSLRSRKSTFGIYCTKISKSIFDYHFSILSEEPHIIRILDGFHIHKIISDDGIHFKGIDDMFLYSTIWMRPLFNDDIKKILGIEFITQKQDNNIYIKFEETLPRFN